MHTMLVHCLQHVDFEGPAAIEDWARQSGHSFSISRPDRGEALPDPSDLDLLILMGGPMSVNDEDQHPWLAAEKKLVRGAIGKDRAILGVCLGAQLIASALGARVYRGEEKEIGWFPVTRTSLEGIGRLLPERFTPLHWHGETFDLPTGAVRLARTEPVPNQAFQLGDGVLGLQFHLEATAESVATLVANAAGEIETGKPFQERPESILARTPSAIGGLHPILWRLLDHLASVRASDQSATARV